MVHTRTQLNTAKRSQQSVRFNYSRIIICIKFVHGKISRMQLYEKCHEHRNYTKLPKFDGSRCLVSYVHRLLRTTPVGVILSPAQAGQSGHCKFYCLYHCRSKPSSLGKASEIEQNRIHSLIVLNSFFMLAD